MNKQNKQFAGRETEILSNKQRGCPQQPHSVAATSITERARVLSLKVDIDWKQEDSRALYNRLRDLSWMAAHYRNQQSVRWFAQMRGWRVDPATADKNDTAKQIRKTEKGELSGDAYSQAEQEVAAAWARDGKRIAAGQPTPMWKTDAALSVSGKEKKQDSGIRLEIEQGQYVLHLRAQSKYSPGGAWLQLPIAKHTKRDEYQGDILRQMVSWETPIKKATVHVKQRGVIVKLSYKVAVPLPRMGERVATLGPVERDGRIHLRTELQTKDYTSRLARFVQLKDSWDKIRRRVMSQIGRKKGHARAKRRKLAEMPWRDRMDSYIHEWTSEVVDWCDSQGVGTIRVESIDTGDWPAYQFVQRLRYKAEEVGIQVVEGADIADESSERAAKAAIEKLKKKASRRNRAVRELTHQIKETA